MPGKLILFPVRDNLTSQGFSGLVRENLTLSKSQRELTYSCIFTEAKHVPLAEADLYVDISYKFTPPWVFVSHACTQITMNTFINDLVLFTEMTRC